MKKKRILAFALSAILAISLMTGCTPKGSTSSAASNESKQESSAVKESSSEKESSSASAFGSLKKFSAKTIDGSTFTQENFKSADITAINFWSTTCSPCIDEMPELAKLSKALPDNVKLITACLDGESDSDTAKKILSDAGFEAPTIISGDGDWNSVVEKIIYTPTTIFIDAEGNIVGDVLEGAPAEKTAEIYREYINTALKAIGKPEMK